MKTSELKIGDFITFHHTKRKIPKGSIGQIVAISLHDYYVDFDDKQINEERGYKVWINNRTIRDSSYFGTIGTWGDLTSNVNLVNIPRLSQNISLASVPYDPAQEVSDENDI